MQRLSDVVQAADDAWAEGGFRLALRGGWETLDGATGYDTGWGVMFTLHPQVRLSRYWSLSVQMQYALLLADAYGGVRFSTAVAAGFHPWRGFAIELGAGYAGQIVNSCDGVGFTAQGRLGYLFAVGELFSTGPVLQAEFLGTHCGSAWWWQRGLQASWAFAWR